MIAAAVFLATRDRTSGGLGGVSPNHVGIIDPKTNHIVDEIQVGLRPGPVAVGGGAAWIGNLDDKTLTKIDTGRRTSARTFPLDNRTPTAIAVGEGSVWVAHGVLGKLSAVEPEFGQVTKTIDVAAGEALGSTNGAVAIDADAVWAVYGDSTLARIDPIDIKVTGRGVTGTAPAGVVVAYELRLGRQHRQRHGAALRPGDLRRGPARDADQCWPAADCDRGRRRRDLGREHRGGHRRDGSARTAGGAPTTEQIDVGDAPTGLAVGAGAVWVANAGDGTVSRIDAAKREVVKTIHIGNAPWGIAFGNGAVWFSVQSP